MELHQDEVLTIDELAAYLKVSKSTLYKLVQEGKIPGQKVGKHWRFHRDVIQRWLTDVILPTVLRSSLKKINPWLDDDQIEEVVKQLTANFPSGSLIENNQHLLHLLLENTSVSEHRKTGDIQRRSTN